MSSNLVRWDFEVTVDMKAMPSNRPGIQYRIMATCPVCKELHEQVSPLFSAVTRANQWQKDFMMKYRMVLKDREGDIVEVIEWVTRSNIGHETRGFVLGSWPCSSCGVVFGLTSDDQSKMLKEVTQLVTIEFLNTEIARLEKTIVADPATSRGHKRRYWYLMTN